MNVGSVICKNAIALSMKASDKDSALRTLVEMLAADGAVTSVDGFMRDIYRREAEGKTGIGDGIAIPHGKSDHVLRTEIAIGRLEKAIPWETLDDNPVRLLILFAVANGDKNDGFLKLMAEVAGKLAYEDVCRKLFEARTVNELLEAFGVSAQH